MLGIDCRLISAPFYLVHRSGGTKPTQTVGHSDHGATRALEVLAGFPQGQIRAPKRLLGLDAKNITLPLQFSHDSSQSFSSE